MYDLHCHILPGFDDGPPSWEASIELARALVEQGVTLVAATPHGLHSNHARDYRVDQLRAAVIRLREHLQRARLSLQVVLGMENELDVRLAEQLRSGERLAYGTSHTMLLESPSDQLSPALEHAIYELQLAGYRVVLAHPERTRGVRENPNSLLPFVERGVLVQVTAASLVGAHGERLQQTALQLLRHGMVQLVASDAHSATGKRAPLMQAARQLVSDLQGAAHAQRIFDDLPHLLMTDGPLPIPTPSPISVTPPTSQRLRWWPFTRH